MGYRILGVERKFMFGNSFVKVRKSRRRWSVCRERDGKHLFSTALKPERTGVRRVTITRVG
jgi:hypothetical protein